MAGISLNAIVGEHGIIQKARKAAEETERAQVQEELELKLIDLQVEKIEAGEDLTTEEIVNRLRMLEGIEVDTTGKTVDGEYKQFGFIIDENLKVSVSSKLKGSKPEGIATVVTKEDGLEEVQIQVMANFKEGTITSIEAINENVEEKDDPSNSSTSKIFIARDNGEYLFRITASNGRSIKVSCEVTNAIPPRDDIITAAARMNVSGIKKAKVNGKTSEEANPEEVIYSFDVIRVEGDLVLDGTDKGIKGLALAGTTYSLGNASDVGTASGYAENTVLLKVEGNLTINSGITLTSITSTYGGPKGMVIYCTGNLINNGTISMTARGGKAKPENVYLYKNLDGSFEYVPAQGGAGGTGASYSYRKTHGGSEGGSGTTKYGTQGTNGSGRSTGGGRGGAAAWSASYYSSAYTLVAVGGTGGTGTAYSGGPGGGSAKTYADSSSYQGNKYGGAGSNEGGGAGAAQNGSAASAGNPSGGTGGLLIVYCNTLKGTGSYLAQGVAGSTNTWPQGAGSGGGSINLFTQTNDANVTPICKTQLEGVNTNYLGASGTYNLGTIINNKYTKVLSRGWK